MKLEKKVTVKVAVNKYIYINIMIGYEVGMV